MDIDHQLLAARVHASIGRSSGSWIWRPLLRRLAQGRPVTCAVLAADTGRPIDEVAAAVAALPDTEYNRAGRIVGHGITLVPTPHRFEIGGRRLFTWCAWDTLLFPVVLGRAARVTSPCHATGRPVQVEVQPGAVTGLDPAEAVVSLTTPDDPDSIRAAFCDQIHFFASVDAARPWLDEHPGAVVLPIAAAFDLATAFART